jgi:hypothetical protein
MEYIVRTNLNSSVLDAIVYNPHQQDLLLTMNGGNKYVYRRVPVDVAVELVTSESAGRYFNRKIKNRFECDKG